MTFEKRVQDKNKMFPIMLLKLIEWVVFKLFAISCYKFAMKVKNYYAFYLKSPSKSSYVQLPSYPSVTKCDLQNRESQTIVCDIHGSLLRTNSFFPFFMLIAFEGGSVLRAFLLLLSCPILLFLDFELKLRVMTFITFCGLNKKYMELVGNAVFPKFYLENLNRHVYEVLACAGVKIVFTSMPRVMVESFLKEYLSVDNVIGTELQMVGNYFTGFITNSGLLNKHKALKDFFGEKKPDIGIGSSTSYDHLFISQCKEAYVVDKEDTKMGSKASSILPREKYPKPLVFHDGRLAFLPTPLASLMTFMWVPLAIPLAIFRISVGALPMKISLLLGCSSGIDLKVKYVNNQNSPTPSKIKNGSGSGVLYVCTHRTLLDPVMLSASLQRHVTAVTYSLSKLTEIIAPIKTVRLTRNREKDGEQMAKYLSEGDLVVCPEGTTCREPYLLRFSSLFAELTDEIVPVAINTHVTMFYGTTASGMKCLDAVFFFMNPKPSYYIQILEKLPKEMTCGGGKSSHEVANYIQGQLGDVLGFECTNLTRKDKYLMLAGNDGLVKGR